MLTVPFVFNASLPSSAAEETNAIFLPSGDQTGSQTTIPLAVYVLSGVAPVPSPFIAQRFVTEFAASLPFRAREETKTIFVPSGDQIGKRESAPLLVSRVRGLAIEPSLLTTQMLLVELALAALLPSKAPLEANATVRTAGLTGGFTLDMLPPQPPISNDHEVMNKDRQTIFLHETSNMLLLLCGPNYREAGDD
jgi:hypothetical protein